MSDLREGLSILRRDSQGAREHKSFYPPSHVKDFLSIDRIRAHIATSIPSLSHGPHDVRRFSSLIHDSSLLIYAILLLSGHEKHVSEFLYRRETDSRLPYTVEGLYFLPKGVALEFVNRQWEMSPICLKMGEIHREIGPREVLPFLEDVECDEGGFGKVYKVQLEPTCQNFVACNEVRTCQNPLNKD